MPSGSPLSAQKREEIAALLPGLLTDETTAERIAKQAGVGRFTVQTMARKAGYLYVSGTGWTKQEPTTPGDGADATTPRPRGGLRPPIAPDVRSRVVAALPDILSGATSGPRIADQCGTSIFTVYKIAKEEGYSFGNNAWTVTRAADPNDASAWNLSADAYEALLKTQAHHPEQPAIATAAQTPPEPADSGAGLWAEDDADISPEEEVSAALEDARATVIQATAAILSLQQSLDEERARSASDQDSLRRLLAEARGEAQSNLQDALRWRERRHQESLHKQHVSVDLLRKGTDELRRLLTGQRP